MRPMRTYAALLGSVLLGTALLPATALAQAPSTVGGGPSSPQAAPERPRHARASLRLDVGQTKPWVGQAVPVTVTAFFRDVEGVTLEGAMQLTSRAVMTSQLARDPRQSTELVDGEQTLVVRWTGTVTPSSAGPLDLSIELPIRLRYREAAPRAVVQDDPFADLGEDPFGSGFGSSIFNQMRQRMQQMLERPLGQVREEAVALKASVRPLEVRALPLADQPATFSGAVGRFDLAASVSSARAHVSEPITLKVAVEGTGDLDRVDLAGVAGSDDWKAYPPKVTRVPATARSAERKLFEQVLVPLRGGDVTVPAVSLTAFDPASGRYVTHETAPIGVSVDGTAVPQSQQPTVAATTVAPAPTPGEEEVPRARLPRVSPWKVVLQVVPVLFVVLAAAVHRVLERRRRERELRKAMTRAARERNAGRFFDSAHRLIQMHLGERWGLAPDAITAETIHERLGPSGDPLADVIASNEALRFARAGMDGAHLESLCSSVRQSLRGVS